jgi:hypothetical protein
MWTRLGEEASGRLAVAGSQDEHVDDLAMLVDRPVDVTPDAADLDVGLIDEPPVTRRVPGRAGRVGEQRGEPLDPPVHRDMIDLDTAFGEQFFHIAVREAVTQIPTHRHRDDLGKGPEAGES